jgi:hypothetical protein
LIWTTVWGDMSRLRSIPAAVLVGLFVAGCVGAGTSPGTSSSPTPSASPAIDYPTDPTAVILRMSTGGGFVAPGVLLTEVAEFSLYGDGTVVFRDPSQMYPAPSPGDGVQRLLPFVTARLSTAAVQALLADAIGPGGLGTARERYDPCCIADAPSTTFTIKTGGVDKQVTVGALGFEQPDPGPDAAARKTFQALAERLHQPDLGGAAGTDYAPAAYRGILFDAIDVSPTAPAIAWPWTDFGPSGFKPSSDPSSMQTPIRTLTAADVAKLGLEGVAGGAQSILLKSDDRIYALALRPLLPDETS